MILIRCWQQRGRQLLLPLECMLALRSVLVQIGWTTSENSNNYYDKWKCLHVLNIYHVKYHVKNGFFKPYSPLSKPANQIEPSCFHQRKKTCSKMFDIYHVNDHVTIAYSHTPPSSKPGHLIKLSCSLNPIKIWFFTMTSVNPSISLRSLTHKRFTKSRLRGLLNLLKNN